MKELRLESFKGLSGVVQLALQKLKGKKAQEDLENKLLADASWSPGSTT